MPSLRRAVELGDAWVPFIIGPDEVRTMLDRAQDTPAWVQRALPLDVALWPEPVLDPLLEPDRVVEQAHEHLASGATILNYRFPSRSVAHHLEQMEALTTLLDPTWTTRSDGSVAFHQRHPRSVPVSGVGERAVP